MKEFNFNINLQIQQIGIESETREEAVDKVKEIFKEEFNIELKNEEIVDDTYRTFGATWCLEDIQQQANYLGYTLTERELNDVADLCDYNFDANVGINWDVIECNVEMIVAERT